MIQNATLRFLRGDHKGVGLRTWTSRFTPLFHFLMNSVSFITWLRWIKFYNTGTGDFNTWLHSNKLFITWNLQICWHICSIWQKQTQRYMNGISAHAKKCSFSYFTEFSGQQNASSIPPSRTPPLFFFCLESLKVTVATNTFHFINKFVLPSSGNFG